MYNSVIQCMGDVPTTVSSVFLLSSGDLCSKICLMKPALVLQCLHVKFLHQQLQGQCCIAQMFSTVEFVLGNNIVVGFFFFFMTKPGFFS